MRLDFEKKKEKAKNFGKVVTRREFLEVVKNEGVSQIFEPYGCLSCGKAKGVGDFEVFYVIYEGGYDRRMAQVLFGVATTGAGFEYGEIVRCKFCGNSDPFSEPKVLE